MRKRAKIDFWERCNGKLERITDSAFESAFKCTKCQKDWTDVSMDISIPDDTKCPAFNQTQAGIDFEKSFWGRLLSYLLF